MRFPGIIPAIITPFTAEDTIDVAALQANVDALLRAGIHGVVATGTMGESASLEIEERRTVIGAISEVVGGRVPVLAGIAAPTARVATRYALAARESGATALMMLPPLNYNGDFREIYAGYFRAVGAAAELPIMAYNNPGASGVELVSRDHRPPGQRGRAGGGHQGMLRARPVTSPRSSAPPPTTSRWWWAATTSRSRASAPAPPPG